MEERILLFIPGYNCGKQIRRVLSQLNDEALDLITHTIVVNNRSTDDTEDKVIQFIHENPEVSLSLLRNDDNYGLGGSHKVAFSYAILNKYDYVIVLHGDDQGSIRDLIPIIKRGDHRKYDCYLGARFMRESNISGYSRFRTFGNQVYNLLFSLAVGRKVFDLGSGLNMYKVSMLQGQYYSKFPDDLTFNYCMVLALDYYKQKAMFFPISWREEDQLSNVKLFKQAIAVLNILSKYTINKKKLIKSELRDRVRHEYTAKLIGGKQVYEYEHV